MTKILIADDEDSIRTILSRTVEKMGHVSVCTDNGVAALELLKSEAFDAAIVDIRMPKLSGLELLAWQNEFAKKTPLIVMTAQDTMENAVAAMKNGAFDYVTKPFDIAEVRILLEHALENARLNEEITRLKQSVPLANVQFIGKSRAQQEIFKTIGKIANQDVTVLIQGESGTGKEVIARAIHTSGNRTGKPFIAVNCSAIPENLLESELFGYKKGAFTGAEFDKPGCFELADGGTIFLDEIGDMPSSLQVKLLRFLQDKTFLRVGDTKLYTIDVRVIAATHRNLKDEIRDGRFREDLFFRLNVVPIFVPPLCERREDILPLVSYFVARYSDLLAGDEKRLTQDTLEFFEYQDWPGNVRELENAIKRILVLARGAVITLAEAKSILGMADTASQVSGSIEDALENLIRIHLNQSGATDNLYATLLPTLERPLIRAVLEKTQGNQLRAAEILGINRNTLRKKILELGLG